MFEFIYLHAYVFAGCYKQGFFSIKKKNYSDSSVTLPIKIRRNIKEVGETGEVNRK